MFNTFLILFYETNETHTQCAKYVLNDFWWWTTDELILWLLQEKSLTSTPRSLVSPAPHPIGQALDVGRANTVVSRVAGKDYFGAILIVRTIDYSPFPVVQRERAETGAHHDWVKKKQKKQKQIISKGIWWGVVIVSLGLFKWNDFCFNFLSYPL